MRLLLFDVDGTLIARGDPAHLSAIDVGVRASFPEIGVTIRDLDFDGKVDRQILRELLLAGGVAEKVELATILTVLEAAAADYRKSWEGRTGDSDMLPGVRALIERLASDDRFALGLLTGGIRGVVEAKLKRLGLERYFPVGAFGDEVERRNELLPLAVGRADDYHATRFAPSDIVVIGDTPHDVAAAHAGEVACLGVATGRFTTTELADAGADAVLSDLSDTDHVIATLHSIRLTAAQR